jgi:hypothetical protein
MAVFWVVAPCGLLAVIYQRFGRIYISSIFRAEVRMVNKWIFA